MHRLSVRVCRSSIQLSQQIRHLVLLFGLELLKPVPLSQSFAMDSRGALPQLVQVTMRFISTSKVLAKRMLRYHRISQCRLKSRERGVETRPQSFGL